MREEFLARLIMARTERMPKEMTDAKGMVDGGGSSKEQKKRLEQSGLLEELLVTMMEMAVRRCYVWNAL